MENFLPVNEKNNLNIILLSLIFLFGGLMLIIPIYYLLLIILGFLTLIFFVLKPDYLYYFTIITFTIQKHIRFSIFDFYLYEIFVLLCLFVGILHFLFQNKKVYMQTKLDPYLFILIIIFSIGGFTSISEYGYIEALKFYEAILFYYITVYYLRAKHLNPVNIIKTVIFAGIIQAFFAIIQSFIGDGSILPIWISSHFGDNRGYLGYLGLGSNFVWHGRGFFTYFIHFGMYMVGTLLFFLPLKKYFTQNKKLYNSIIILFIFAIIISYSRSALLALYLGLFYYAWFIAINKKKFIAIFTVITAIMVGLGFFVANTSYASTICTRTDIWAATVNIIFSSIKNILIGSGFNSFEYVVIQAKSPYIHYYLSPHSFYLEIALNLGLVGLATITGFLLKTFMDTYNKFKNSFSGLYNKLSLSVHLVLFSVFIAGIWDRTYVHAAFFIILLSYLGILYAENKELPE